MRTFRPVLLASVLLSAAASPARAADPQPPASSDVQTSQSQEKAVEQLPSWAQQEWDVAQSVHPDPIEAARALPPPPDSISRAQGQAAPAGTRVEAVPPSEQARPGVGFDDFYTGLSPYGTWIETPEYGYVFVPTRQVQVSNWRPYVYGRWIWTSYGWTWVSEEPFGWATYHYGRWTIVPGFGWAWVPGYTWGPAWVTWRYGTDAIGWAPLLPGYVTWTTSYPVYYDAWVFIGPRYFYSYPVYHHHYHWSDCRRYYGATHWASNWRGSRGYVYAGPPRSYVERRSPVPVRQTRLETVSRPDRATVIRGDRAPERVALYRPDARGAESPRAFVPKGREIRVPSNARVPVGVGSGLAPGRQSLQPGGRPNVGAMPAVPRAGQGARSSLPTPVPQVAPRAGEVRPQVSGRVASPPMGEGRPTVAPPQGGAGQRIPTVPAPNQRVAPSAPSVTPRVAPPAGSQRVAPMPAPSAPSVAPRVAPPAGSQRVAPMPAPSAPSVSPRVAPPPAAAPRVAPMPAPSAPSVTPRVAPPPAAAPRVAPAPAPAPRVAPPPAAPRPAAPPAGGGGARRSSYERPSKRESGGSSFRREPQAAPARTPVIRSGSSPTVRTGGAAKGAPRATQTIRTR